METLTASLHFFLHIAGNPRRSQTPVAIRMFQYQLNSSSQSSFDLASISDSSPTMDQIRGTKFRQTDTPTKAHVVTPIKAFLPPPSESESESESESDAAAAWGTARLPAPGELASKSSLRLAAICAAAKPAMPATAQKQKQQSDASGRSATSPSTRNTVFNGMGELSHS
mmetsp:Transcript_20609/g.44844  ORF Transcript_20609/g.44844 Transcript_20609/m.44844 type:complete len:169 (+) Transcript_20609:181-687(+)